MTAITMKAFMTAITTGELVINTKNEQDETVKVTKSIFNEDGTLIPEVIAYAEEQIDKINQKNESRKASPRKKTADQIKNDELRDEIYSLMEDGIYYTSKDIIAFGIEGVASPQKVTALMKGMVATGKVTVADVKSETSKGKVKGYTKASVSETESETTSEDSESAED